MTATPIRTRESPSHRGTRARTAPMTAIGSNSAGSDRDCSLFSAADQRGPVASVYRSVILSTPRQPGRSDEDGHRSRPEQDDQGEERPDIRRCDVADDPEDDPGEHSPR